MAIHQEVTIPAAPSAVFDVLMNSKKFADMTGGRSADISAEEGGEFSMFGGDITGRNIELVPGKRVVQAWRSGAWPAGVYSIIKFELELEGRGTKLTFDQSGYPDDAHDMLAGGWQQMYWDPMSKMLGGM
jgi:activator of HSP90 ATPase